jgi:hypothetical protein
MKDTFSSLIFIHQKKTYESRDITSFKIHFALLPVEIPHSGPAAFQHCLKKIDVKTNTKFFADKIHFILKAYTRFTPG